MNALDRLIELLGLTKEEPKKKAAESATKSDSQGPKAAQDLQLDASELLPITSDELRTSLEALIRSGDWRFTFRGTIPVADERTRLINRALLTQGYLTPEQLDQILQTAIEFERLEKAMVVVEEKAGKAGEAAVEADREARQRLKAEKKAAAAERNRLHAEAVAFRRANDILFLGQGVSARLNDRQSDVAKLEQLGLPVVATAAELAGALGIEVPRLRWLAFHTEVATRLHYVHFEVPKRSGGVRRLSAPHASLAQTQQWIFREILNKLPVEEMAHGFVRGRNVLTNAQPHVGQPVILNLDLENFFPSISWVRIRALFQRLGYSGAVATILALLCTECPREAVEYAGTHYYVATGPRGLPQGASTSPALSNQIARRLDRRLKGLADKMGLVYTRYADDLTLSGPAELNSKVGYLMARVRHIAGEEGFRINSKKTRVLRRNTAQTVTGVVVNEKVNLSRRELRRLRAILHQAAKTGLEAQNRDEQPHFAAWLRGKIAYVRMVRPDLAEKLLTQYRQAIGE